MGQKTIELTEDELKDFFEARNKANELRNFSSKKIIDREIQDIMKYKDYRSIKIKQLTDDLVVVMAVLGCVFAFLLGYYVGKFM